MIAKGIWLETMRGEVALTFIAMVVLIRLLTPADLMRGKDHERIDVSDPGTSQPMEEKGFHAPLYTLAQ
ncbi:hypothetical protein ACFSTI_26385 [Rhizorhabdus histidinilytica]